MKIEKIKCEFLKSKREEAKLSIDEVAKSVGLSSATIYAIELGSRKVSIKLIDKIISTLGLDPMYKKFLIYPEDILLKETLTRGEYIKFIRMESGLKLPELSKEIGVAVSTLSCIEISSRNLTGRVYDKIAECLDIKNIEYMDFKTPKAFMLYSLDENKIPLIEGIYLNREELEKARAVVKNKYKNYLWRVREYEFDTTVKERREKKSKELE